MPQSFCIASESPQLKANFISRIFYWWLNPLFKKGYKQSLEFCHLYKVLPEDESNPLGSQLEAEWNCIRRRSEENKDSATKGLLFNVLWKIFGWRFIGIGFIKFFEECVSKIATPICLGILLRYFTGEFSAKVGYLCCGGIILGSIVNIITMHPYFQKIEHLGMNIRIACSTLLFKKILKVKLSSLGDSNAGQVMNLLANDLSRFDNLQHIHYLWIGIVQTVISTLILWKHFGAACLCGLAVLILFVPFQAFLGSLFTKLRIIITVRTDKRVRAMKELLEGIQAIKMYCWENTFFNLIKSIRREELNSVKKIVALRSMNWSLYYTSSKVTIFLTIIAYVLSGNILSAEIVFVAVSMYNNMRITMTLHFPLGVEQLADFFVTVNRFEKFLLLEEREALYPKENTTTEVCKVCPRISLKNVSTKWLTDSKVNVLHGINMEAKGNQLIMVSGPVGSGKSSLLHVLLKELTVTQGSVEISGSVSYSSQEPWIFCASIKDNILFGRPYDNIFYKKVVDACELKRDFELLPNGDDSFVGERGASLSGGQKARLSLARAVYSNADIVLLDDPLSSIDGEVANAIFEKCFKNLLQNKLVILVTHQLNYIKSVDKIVVMKQGQIINQGTYNDFMDNPKLSVELKNIRNNYPNKTLSKIDGAEEMEALDDHIDSAESSGEMRKWRNKNQSNETVTVNQLDSESDRRKIKNMDNAEIKLCPNGVTENNNSTSPVSSGINSELLEEEMSSGTVKMSIYSRYFSAGSNIFTISLLIVFNILTQLLHSGSDYWLQIWSNLQENVNAQRHLNVIPKENSEFSNNTFGFIYSFRNQVLLYSSIIFFLFVFSMIRTTIFFHICLNSCTFLHNKMLKGIIEAPMNFFHVNTIGRIMNRCTKDTDIMDNVLPNTFFETMEIFLNVLGIIILVSIVSPYILIPTVFLAIAFYYVRKIYVNSSRSVKRLEAIARSPVYSHLSTTVNGLTTIRAFKVEKKFEEEFCQYQDIHSATWFLAIVMTRWIGFYLDCISVIFTTALVISLMLTSSTTGAGAGMAISSAMFLTGVFQYGTRQSATVESQMVSIERILEYTTLKPEEEEEEEEEAEEKEHDVGESLERKPSEFWPSNGCIQFINYNLQYKKGERMILKNINISIKPQEKVAIVGRTGSGKTSLINALFRLTEPTSGSIEIDGVNIHSLKLHELRSKISVIPQEPFLFHGTVRANMTVNNNYNDDEIWRALSDVEMSYMLKSSPMGLNTLVNHFSMGQRQLLVLARSILSRNKILVLDEASASVDTSTDVKIQKIIREKFKDCVLLVIAHKLMTIMDMDRVLVLENGVVKEFDTPFSLLENKNSSFNSMVEQMGRYSSSQLRQIATDSFIRSGHQ